MEWICVYNGLEDHPKIRQLARELQCNRYEAIGLLVCLWLWGLNNADEDGRILNATANDIEIGIMACGQSEGLSAKSPVQALINAGFISEKNGEYYIHDWDEHQEYYYKYKARKAADSARKRIERANKKTKKSIGQSADYPPDCPDKIKTNHKDIYCAVVGFLNDKAGTSFKPNTKATQRLIDARMHEGFTLDDFKTVIGNRTEAWKGDKQMAQYLRPATLFGTKFESYLQAVPTQRSPDPRRVFQQTGVDGDGTPIGYYTEAQK